MNAPAPAMQWTEFPTVKADRKTEHTHTWPELVEYVRNAGPYAAKTSCPLLSLAAYGTQRTASQSMRSAANLLAVHGVEGDYDAGAMTMAEAVAALERHGIRAAVYPSPSHTPEKPRWRVIAPLATPCHPPERARMVARLNGALGGILADESFALSQSFYFGRVNADWTVLCAFDDPTEGNCIDELPELESIAVGKREAGPTHEGEERLSVDSAIFSDRCAALGRKLRTGDGRRDLLKTWIASRSARGQGLEDLKLSVRGVVYEFFDPNDEPDWADIDKMAEDFARKDYVPPVDASALLGGTVRRGQTVPPLDDDAADAWPEPTPLPDALPPVQPFDPDLLPDALRGWVTDIAHRMQCPPDFPAVGAVVALSSLIGARAVVQPKARGDWQVVPNLWGLIVGRPGVMKSPALGESLKPLNRLQATEYEQWQAAHEAWELDCKVSELQATDREKKAKGIVGKDPAAARALLEPGDTPAEPLARRYIVNDATVEKLGELLTVNRWGTLSYRDELYGLLTGMDKQGQEGSRAFYLQSYDGNQGYTFDRIIRGTVHIPRVCLAMIGGIQPGRIQEYVRGAVSGGSADDGLLQRFSLAVWPDVNREFQRVDQWPDTPAKQAAWTVFERLAQLQPASDADPVIWRFSEQAQAIYWQWAEPFEHEIRGEELHPAMVSHLAKYRKLIPALALIFALIDTPESGNVIHERELIRALAWGDYLRSHAERLYAAAVIPETAGARALLAKLKSGKLTDRDGVIADSFTPRQIAVKGWAGLTTPDAVRKAADVLADYEYLRRELVQSSDVLGRGRPSDRYIIHPAMLGSAGAV